MLNILFFFYFSYLVARLVSKRAYSKDCTYLALLIGYVAIMDLANTNGTLYTNGALIIIASFAIKLILTICAYKTLNKCKMIETKIKREASLFKRSTALSHRNYSKAS